MLIAPGSSDRSDCTIIVVTSLSYSVTISGHHCQGGLRDPSRSEAYGSAPRVRILRSLELTPAKFCGSGTSGTAQR